MERQGLEVVEKEQTMLARTLMLIQDLVAVLQKELVVLLVKMHLVMVDQVLLLFAININRELNVLFVGFGNIKGRLRENYRYL